MEIGRNALISDCGLYRYTLFRRIDDKNDKCLAFIMLNPSTADATIDDPTIRKCKGFAERMGYSWIHVVNLFAYRATSPKEIKKASNPIGDDNILHIRAAAAMADKIICAWGCSGTYGRQNEKVMELLSGYDLHALEITKHGHPKHPLYISYDKEPVLFKERD